MNLSQRQLQVFLTTAETLNLSRASERVLFAPVERVIARRWGTVAS